MTNSKFKNFINKKFRSKIVCLTAYSKNITKNIDPYADLILVGDSYLRAYHSAIVKKYHQSNFLWFEAPGCEFFSTKYFGLTTSKKKMDSCKHYRSESFKLLKI